MKDENKKVCYILTVKRNPININEYEVVERSLFKYI